MTLMIERADSRETASARLIAAARSRNWSRVCRVDDLEPGWGEAVLLAERQVALFRVGDRELYAVDHIDPKTAAPVIARGIVGSKGDRTTVASPLLKQVYDLETGECLSESGPSLATYRTRVVSGYVEIEAAAS
ncbi:nitrite reductase small subunit NirD [Planctomonas sp. JC2975]|uniref:nitrite reductase small subunit NirD n=1 Tax=Planctomonas sp. JC2975 TaxID=2729626 RepID=UPI00147583DD|nr:nitrite reductase small subunit NirD [Planctomonas sp. JC2975]NNC10962.1 nitrite reductase small subunit NirD [Planctomonas sp. JC2975]